MFSSLSLYKFNIKNKKGDLKYCGSKEQKGEISNTVDLPELYIYFMIISRLLKASMILVTYRFNILGKLGYYAFFV